MRSFMILYSSANIIRVIQTGRMRFVGHVAHVGEMRNTFAQKT
jgi:hypothetical protein